MNHKRLQPLLLPTILIAAAIGVRLWFLLRLSIIQSDSSLYGEIAQNWLDFHIYGFSTDALPRPTLIRLPGYPLFLILSSFLFGHRFHQDTFSAALFTQAALDVLACYLIAKAASDALQQSMGHAIARRAFLLGLLVTATCPFTANYTATPLTESSTLFTIAVTLYVFQRWRTTMLQTASHYNRYLFLLAAALGASILLRPDQILLLVAVVCILLGLSEQLTPRMMAAAAKLRPQAHTVRQKLRQHVRSISRQNLATATILLLLSLLPLVPWTIRNARTFHVFQPLAPRYATDPGEPVGLGFQRWYKTWAIDFASTEEFYWKYPDEDLDVANLPNRAFDSDAEYDTTAQLLEDSNALPHLHQQIDGRFAKLAAQRIQADPLRYYVELPVARLGNMLFHPRTEMLPYDLRWWSYNSHPGETIRSWIFVLLNAAYYLAAFLGARRAWRYARALTAIGVLYLVLRCLLLLTLDNSEQRYTIELYPILLLWIAFLAVPRGATRHNPA